jgi:FixJ family two-component response regulator
VLGAAAPDRAGRPALRGDLRPGAGRRRRTRGTQTAATLPGPTAAEQAVPRLVAAARSNRQTAAELYVSVTTGESTSGTSSTSLASDPAKTSSTASAPRHPA